jgi:hypothetical protein
VRGIIIRPFRSSSPAKASSDRHGQGIVEQMEHAGIVTRQIRQGSRIDIGMIKHRLLDTRPIGHAFGIYGADHVPGAPCEHARQLRDVKGLVIVMKNRWLLSVAHTNSFANTLRA